VVECYCFYFFKQFDFQPLRQHTKNVTFDRDERAAALDLEQRDPAVQRLEELLIQVN
jgi:hypothetical protein